MRRRALLASCALLAGCGSPTAPGDGDTGTTEDGTGDEGASPSVTTTRPRDSPFPPPPADATFAYTHLRPDGNRYVQGTGAIPEATPVDVSLPAPPEWVVGVPGGATPTGEPTIVVVLADGRALAVSTAGETSHELDTPGPGPPLVVADGESLSLAPPLGSALTHPVPAPGGWAAVREDGRLTLPAGENVRVDALPDARIVAAAGRFYVFAERTTDYAHGALGDDVEAGGVAVVDPRGGVERTLRPPAGVLEGLAPIVADVDGDGEREVVVTASDATDGARIAALGEDGSVRAGPAVGSGFRWRHQLAVAPFGPDGETEIASVLTPHVGGTAEFFRAAGGGLDRVATLRGYSSHAIGARNLDMAAAADFDGDGRVELLVPDDPQRALAGLRRVAGGVEEAWRLPLPGRLRTNVAVVPGERAAVVAGTESGLRVWR